MGIFGNVVGWGVRGRQFVVVEIDSGLGLGSVKGRGGVHKYYNVG